MSEKIEVCQTYETDPKHMELAREALTEEETIIKASKILSALSDKTRFKILLALSHTSLCVCELEELVSLSQSAISHQLRILRDANLVSSKRVGQKAVYFLSDEHVEALISQSMKHAQHK